MGVKKITDDSGKEVKLVKVRNPWGTEKYNGDYSDSSAKWTSDAMRKRAGLVKANDGEFFMPINLYRTNFESTSVSYNMDNVTSAHHLTLNGPKKQTGTSVFCPTCSIHKYNITTAKDQKVNLRASTWDARGLPATC